MYMFVALMRTECHQSAYIVKVLENDFTLKVVESRPMSKSGVYSFLFQFVLFFYSGFRFLSFTCQACDLGLYLCHTHDARTSMRRWLFKSRAYRYCLFVNKSQVQSKPFNKLSTYLNNI